MPGWTPLECDSDVLTEYARVLTGNGTLQFHDVFCFDDLSTVDGLRCMLLVYPLSVTPNLTHQPAPGSPVFIKQDIDNACGTVALLHALHNLGLIQDRRQLDSCKDIHHRFALASDTEVDEDANLHFVAIVADADQNVIWYDGRLEGPVLLGRCSPGDSVGRFLSTEIAKVLDLSATPCLSALYMTLE